MLRFGWLIAGVVLILGGSYLAHRVQTAGGTVSVQDVRFPGAKGVTMSGLLYTPASATAARPAPAVLVSHGYINTREMQSAFAIELSRRGFVVLAMDMTGHGYSGGNVAANAFGGPDALAYLQGLPQVDRANIGMEGHSLGGGPVLAAAASQPDGYRSVVLEGTSPALFGPLAAMASPSFPRNAALVFGRYDEFAPLMWGKARGSEIADAPKLMALFGATAPVVEGRVYGDLAAGTARVLHMPAITHPWEHFSQGGVAPAVDWFQKTLAGAAAPKDPADQVWIWKEAGTGAAFAGFVFLLMGTFQALLGLPVFAALRQAPEPARERRDGRWWLAFALTAAVPAITFFPFMKLGALFFPMPAFPQYITNQLLVWALLNAAITAVLAWRLGRGGRPVFHNRWARAVALGVATVAAGYASLAFVDWAFKVDYRFWVLGLKPLDGPHALTALAYLPLWTVFFLVALRALAANLAVKGEGEMAAMTAAKMAMALGFVLLLAVQYASLFATGVLAIPSEPLNTIVAIQFVPLLAMVGAIGAFTYRRTGSYVPGAVVCALVISWYVTAGTATHWSPDFPLPRIG